MKAFHVSSLILCALLTGCGQDAPASTPAAPKTSMTVTAAPAHLQMLAQGVDAQGAIAPWQEAIISARVGGLTLLELNVQVGEQVKKGQVLARFDSRIVNAELTQARANLAQAAANAAQASANLDRTLRMKGRGAMSEQEQQMARTQAETAEAQREMAAAQVTAQEIRLQDCDVRAVDNGVISARNATLGQVAQPGTELFRLIRQERLEWQAELSAQQLGQVRKGQTVSIKLPGGSLVKGTVRQLAPSLNNATRLGLVYVDLEPGSDARAGMYVGGQIHLEQGESMMVPAEAVVLRDGRSSVFRMNERDQVVQVSVETGRRQGKLIEIIQGLQAGDLVAVRGAGFLSDGDQVKRAPDKNLDVQASNLHDAGATQ